MLRKTVEYERQVKIDSSWAYISLVPMIKTPDYKWPKKKKKKSKLGFQHKEIPLTHETAKIPSPDLGRRRGSHDYII